MTRCLEIFIVRRLNEICSVIASCINMMSKYFVIKRSVNSIWTKTVVHTLDNFFLICQCRWRLPFLRPFTSNIKNRSLQSSTHSSYREIALCNLVSIRYKSIADSTKTKQKSVIADEAHIHREAATS